MSTPTTRPTPWRRLSVALPGQGGFYEAPVEPNPHPQTLDRVAELSTFGDATLTPAGVVEVTYKGVVHAINTAELGDAEVAELRTRRIGGASGINLLQIDTIPAP
jgi:hypothetical protein